MNVPRPARRSGGNGVADGRGIVRAVPRRAGLSYLALTDADRESMLETIGVDSIEELFAGLPAGIRLDRPLDLPPALTEQELTAYFEALAARNDHNGAHVSFLGAGLYDHYVPAIVDAVLQRGELLTAYTPYQPELSQ